MICGLLSSGSQRPARIRIGSPQRCKPNTSLPVAKPHAAAANHAWSRNLRIRNCCRARGPSVLCGGQGESCDEQDQPNRKPGKCFARPLLKRTREERSSLGPACASFAAESGKSRSFWLGGRYADTAKLACSIKWCHAA